RQPPRPSGGAQRTNPTNAGAPGSHPVPDRPHRLKLPKGRPVYRTTIDGSWGWMKWDLPLRLVPLLAAPGVFAWVSQTPLSDLGVNLSHPLRDLLLAIPLGLL